MTTDNQPEQQPWPESYMAERKRVFLEELERTGVAKDAFRKADASQGLLYQWIDEDHEFHKAFQDALFRARERIHEDVKKRIAAGEKVANVERRRAFLTEFAAVGAMSPAADAAGLSLRTIAGWLQEKQGFREDLHEARLRFHDRLEVQALQQILEGKNPALLRFKLQAELPEKYGRTKPPKPRHGLTMDDIERMAQKARESNDEAAT